MTDQPVVSVIVVSDYAAGETKSWHDIRVCLDALAAQDFDEPVEFILVEEDAYRDAVPPGLPSRLPGLRLEFANARTSYELKNLGVAVARAPLVAMLDADCVPQPGWLRHCVAAFRAHPRIAAVSGRTLYPSKNRLERCLALVTRSIESLPGAGLTSRVSSHNGGYRRDVLRRFPYTLEAGIWGARLQSEALLRAGEQLYFEPRMVAIHDHTGWSMEADMRRSIGQGLVLTRRADPLQPFAWVLRLGYASVPVFVFGQTLMTARRCLTQHRHYGVQWYELPLAIALGLVTHAMEVPGIVGALRGKLATSSRYR